MRMLDKFLILAIPSFYPLKIILMVRWSMHVQKKSRRRSLFPEFIDCASPHLLHIYSAIENCQISESVVMMKMHDNNYHLFHLTPCGDIIASFFSVRFGPPPHLNKWIHNQTLCLRRHKWSSLSRLADKRTSCL